MGRDIRKALDTIKARLPAEATDFEAVAIAKEAHVIALRTGCLAIPLAQLKAIRPRPYRGALV